MVYLSLQSLAAQIFEFNGLQLTNNEMDEDNVVRCCLVYSLSINLYISPMS